jgi:hypothetical protein
MSLMFVFCGHKVGPGFQTCKKAFFLLISVVSVLGAFKLLHLAAVKLEPAELAATNPLERMLSAQMERGALSPLFVLTLGLPFAATPAGFPPYIARKIAMFHLVVLFVVFVIISKRIEVPCEPQCSPSESADRWVALIHDFSVTIAVLGIVYFGCVPATEAGDEMVAILARQDHDLRAGRHADSVLNHVLKNSMAIVCASLEIQLMESQPVSRSLPEQEADTTGMTTRASVLSAREKISSAEDRKWLEEALSELYRGMTWITSRQVLLAVAAETYQTSQSPIVIDNFFRSIATGGDFQFNDTTKSVTHALGTRKKLAFDEKMARLALENGKTNALLHGDGGEIKFGAEFRREGEL